MSVVSWRGLQIYNACSSRIQGLGDHGFVIPISKIENMKTITFKNGDTDEQVAVRSGSHAMVQTEGMFGSRYRKATDGEDAVEVYSICRADGTVWLIPAEMLDLST